MENKTNSNSKNNKLKKYLLVLLIAFLIPIVYTLVDYFNFFKPGYTKKYSSEKEIVIKKSFNKNGCYEIGLWAGDTRFNNHITNGKYELNFYSDNQLLKKQILTKDNQSAYSIKTGNSSFMALETFKIPFKNKHSSLTIKFKTLKVDSLTKDNDNLYLYIKKSKYVCGKAKKLSNRSKANNYITNAETNTTLQPLFRALMKSNTEEVVEIFNNGISIEVEMFGQRKPIHYSAYINDVKTMQYLIDKKVNLNIKDIIEKTPLHYAIENNSTKTLKLLLDNGADLSLVETVDKQYFNGPYKAYNEMYLNYYVVKRNLIEMTKILLEHGMDINKLYGKRKQTPYDSIMWRDKYAKIKKLIRQYGAKTYDELQQENNITKGNK